MPSDEVIVSHESALLYHRARRLAEARGNDLEVESVTDLLALLGQPKLDVLVLDGHNRSRHTDVREHASSRETLSFTTPIVPGLRISTPELALWQLAGVKHPTDVELIAYEACGSYVPDNTSTVGCICDLAPLCSTGSIARIADELDGTVGRRRRARVRNLLASVVDAAASPAEAKLCLAMVSPRLAGGFGLPKPILNSEVILTGDARALTKKRTVMPDGLWAAEGLMYEYLGAIHASQKKMEEDAGRDNALLAMGYQVMRITRKQVNNYDLYRGLMETIRLNLHVRLELPSPRILEQQYSLWKKLYRSNGD